MSEPVGEKPSYVASCVLTNADYVNGLSGKGSQFDWHSSLRWSMRVVGVVVSGLVVHHYEPTHIGIWLCAAAVYLVGMYVFDAGITDWNVGQRIIFDIYPHWIRIRTGKSVVAMQWRAFRSVRETAGGDAVLDMDRSHRIVVPARGFSSPAAAQEAADAIRRYFELARSTPEPGAKDAAAWPPAPEAEGFADFSALGFESGLRSIVAAEGSVTPQDQSAALRVVHQIARQEALPGYGAVAAMIVLVAAWLHAPWMLAILLVYAASVIAEVMTTEPPRPGAVGPYRFDLDAESVRIATPVRVSSYRLDSLPRLKFAPEALIVYSAEYAPDVVPMTVFGNPARAQEVVEQLVASARAARTAAGKRQ